MNKSSVMRQKLGAIWQAFNRGEDVPRVLVVGPGWEPPGSSWRPPEIVDWDDPEVFRRAYYGAPFKERKPS